MDIGDVGSPEGLIKQILKSEPNLSVPVPIEELAIQLDIERIAELETEGFEGGLLTDDCRSRGIILVNKAAKRGRRRFTISHELGHFLIPMHRPVKAGQFLCSREDMRRWSTKETDAYARMEVEANRFAALILMPPPKLRAFMGRFRDPTLAHIIDVATYFDVSKDAAARAYAEYHDQAIAIVVVRDQKIQRVYRSTKFPRIDVDNGAHIPSKSLFHHMPARKNNPSEIQENDAGLWIVSDWGKRLPTLYEQLFIQQEGFALIMLWAEIGDEEDDDEDENRTSKERLRHRQSVRSRY